MKEKIRINVRLRDLGLTTRREADTLVSSGKVFVNGIRGTLGMKVSELDKIEIRGKRSYRYFLYNKPIGIVTTGSQNDEISILDTAKFPLKVFPIGRLDKDSSGLIILTNDGRITEELLSPEKEHEKEYEVEVDKPLKKDFKQKVEAGVEVPKTSQGKDGYTTKQCKVKITEEKSFNIILTEGKNRQIRRMCETLGYKVVSLKRVRIGKFNLGHLKPGEWREIKI